MEIRQRKDEVQLKKKSKYVKVYKKKRAQNEINPLNDIILSELILYHHQSKYFIEKIKKFY